MRDCGQLVVGWDATGADLVAVELHPLLERARNGDAAAYEAVYREHATPLLRQAMTLCGNEALAEELAQDTLVEAWRGLRGYRGRCAFFTWLCAILVNRYRNHLRRRRGFGWWGWAAGSDDERVGDLERLRDPAAGPDELADRADQAGLMRRCIDRLPPRQRQVVFLRFYVDESLEGIAGALGCSVGTVKSRLFHALERLRRMRAVQAHADRKLTTTGTP